MNSNRLPHRIRLADEEARFTPGLRTDHDAPAGMPTVHPFVCQSWAVYEIRTGEARVTWATSTGREEIGR